MPGVVGVNQLQKNVADTERQTVALRLQGEQKMEAERERLRQVQATRKEFAELHAQALQEAADEHAQQMSNALDRAERQCAEAAEEKAAGMKRIKEANERSAALEAEFRELETRWRLLNGQLDTNEANHEAGCQDVMQKTSRAVYEKEEGTRRVIHSTTLFASEMQEISLRAIADMQDEAKVAVASAEGGARRRTRFQEFYDMLQSHKAMELSPESATQAQMDMLKAWLDDWVENTGQAVPQQPPLLFTPVGQTLAPLSPTRVRAKDIHLKKASFQQEQQQPALDWCPLNAPF